jgi:putative endopeptidase
VDPSSRPGDDFFGYVNGDWMEKHPVPPDKSSYGAFTEVLDRTEEDLRLLLDEAARAPMVEDGSITGKIGIFYRTGMDTATIEGQGTTPLAGELRRIDSIGSTPDLLAAIGHLVASGLSPLFEVSAQVDPKESSMMIAALSQGGLGLPNREYYTREDAASIKLRDEYRNHIRRIFELLGDGPGSAEEHAGVVTGIEADLAGFSFPPEVERDPDATYHRITLAELDRTTPAMAWNALLSDIRYPGIRELNLREPQFISGLDGLIRSVPLEAWKAFLRWKLVSALAPCLDSGFEEENFDFYGRRMNGQPEMKPRWKRVMGMLDFALGEGVGELYVRRFFSPEARARVVVMVENLRKAFRSRLETLDWMEPATREEALRKLSAMQFKIGYPNRWRDYTGLGVRPDSYAENVMRAMEFDFREGTFGMERVGKPVDRELWFMTPQTVNAAYDPPANEMVFPAGILKPPLFTPEADDATNYGAIGAIIGHEMIHGFDDTGRKYDSAGNLRDWWTEHDAREFGRRAHQLADRFDAFEVLPGLPANGRLTLGENIADLGGITIAYHAYRVASGTGGSANGGGVEGDRRFFTSFARVWRESIRDEALRTGVLSDVHSPGRLRVNGILFNVPEFYGAFPEIGPGDRLYLSPDQRIAIW